MYIVTYDEYTKEAVNIVEAKKCFLTLLKKYDTIGLTCNDNQRYPKRIADCSPCHSFYPINGKGQQGNRAGLLVWLQED